MGSTGSGRFGTYRDMGAGSISNGKIAEEIQCPLVIENIRLEDVATSKYFMTRCVVPPIEESVQLSMHLVNKRLAVILVSTEEVIGNLPVNYNYLNICMKKGIQYSGSVKSSGISPIPYIVIDLYA